MPYDDAAFDVFLPCRPTDVPFLPTVRYRNSLPAAAAVARPTSPSSATRAVCSIISFRSGARAVYYFEIRKREPYLLFLDRRTECELQPSDSSYFYRFVYVLFSDRDLTDHSPAHSNCRTHTFQQSRR